MTNVFLYEGRNSYFDKKNSLENNKSAITKSAHQEGWYPQPPPPFIGSWPKSIGTEGAGKKKKKDNQRKRTTFGQKLTFQQNSSRGYKFVKHCPIMTSTGLSLFSKDQISNKHNTGYYVIDLDDSLGSGTHWLVMNIKRDLTLSLPRVPYGTLA